jgi:hypothetical protein
LLKRESRRTDAPAEETMFATHVRDLAQPAVREAPPSWTVLTVKSCVVGLLVLPLAMPILLAASMALGPGADLGRKIAFASSVVVWVGLFACAQVLTTLFPPVPRRSR